MRTNVIPADFFGLASICWNRDPERPIDRQTAWALYRRNWRFIWEDEMLPEELELIKTLEDEFGKGEKLLGTPGPVPPFARGLTEV